MRCLHSKVNNLQLDKFIYYDFECTQENGEHIPNLVVSQSVCSLCEKVEKLENCESCGSRCSNCSKLEKGDYVMKPCLNTCGQREKVFKGKECKNNFCKWLISDQHKNFTVIAHNGKAYDLHFIFAYCIRNVLSPTVILNGTKILYMAIKKRLNLRFLDSVNFLPMALSKIPKSLELSELKKGYFPHYFNTESNQNVELDKLPDLHYYDPDSMSEQGREQFLKWYGEHKNDNFIFPEEILSYCKSDVDILRRGCVKYRNLILQITGETQTILNENMLTEEIVVNGVDPFQFITLASLCMGVFRSKFLAEEWKVLEKKNAQANCKHEMNCMCTWTRARKLTGDSEIEVLNNSDYISFDEQEHLLPKFVKSPIGLLPQTAYGRKDNQSLIALVWLKKLESDWNEKHEQNISIRHANSLDGEKEIYYQNVTNLNMPVIKYKADGYFEDEKNGDLYVCEFYGCHWHGCKKCFSNNRNSIIISGISAEERYQNTYIREKRIQEMGFKLITMWECEFSENIKTLTQEEIEEVENISLRSCYFGGRTNAIKLYHLFKKGEKGKYVDFCSLYPYILKYYKFPVGHPEKISKHFKNNIYEKCTKTDCHFQHEVHTTFPYFGIAKVKILPPRNLFHPVLPLRLNGKLKFPLCKTCATLPEIDQGRECKCSDEERSFIYTYCTPELEASLNMGYKLLKIYQILHWKETDVYNIDTKKGGMFTEYVNTFLKLKQEASGLPDNLKLDEDIEKYIEKYFEKEGILLDRKQIKKNSGIRQCAKLNLNSFYGKFGQKTTKRQTVYASKAEDVYRNILDKKKKLLNFHILSENMLQLEFEEDELFQDISLSTNVLLAAMCTCWARLTLWKVMFTLGERVLYHDTDSIIYTSKEDEYDPPTGEFLGDLTDELSCSKIGCEGCEIGHWIKEFVSCGPKNYAFKLNSGEVTCKVRGFSLNHRNAEILNFESMKDALKCWYIKRLNPHSDIDTHKEQLITVTTRILRDNKKCKVYSKKVSKTYGIVYDKRKVIENYQTIPFGFER